MVDRNPLLLTRRENLLAMVPGFILYALLAESRAAAVPGRRSSSPARWIDGQHQIAQDLAAGRMTGIDWGLEVARLAKEVDVGELMALVQRSKITHGQPPGGTDPRKRYVNFLDEAGAPRKLAYGVALFEFEPGNVITPHGHKNMVSAHMVVNGTFRVRNFDRLHDEAGAMVIRPTRDYLARAGDVSTMCSERDNIHWFVPQQGVGTTFDVVISGLDPSMPEYEIKAVDPVRGRRLADGAIIAPVIDFAESSRLYTSQV